MPTPVAPATERSVVLLGAGHTHLHVLRHWVAQAPTRTMLTCVSNFDTATYSGMLPGVLAGEYATSAMEIPLAALCAAAGATLIIDETRTVDIAARRLTLSDDRVVPFDVLSVGVGSVPRTDGVTIVGERGLVQVKPMQTFLARFHQACQRVETVGRCRIHLVTVGGGAGGVEITLCLPRFAEAALGRGVSIDRTLVTSTPLMSDAGLGLARRARRALERTGVHLLEGHRVTAVGGGTLRLDDGATLAADVVVWATGAAPAPILRAVDLPKDRAGFLQVTDSLHSPADPTVFAVGDSAAFVVQPVAKAGVYAVREGAVLLENIRRTLEAVPLRPFSPQSGVLKLLNMGDGRAMGEWQGLSFEGRWCRQLKHLIDRRFVGRYQAVRSRTPC